jgi:hypothetical protein
MIEGYNGENSCALTRFVRARRHRKWYKRAMDNWFAYFSAIGSNTVSLWSGLIGLLFTAYGLFYKETTHRKLFIGAGVISLILSPGFAWIEEHRFRLGEREALVELQKIRPYVFIEGIPATMVRAYMLQNPNNTVFPEGAYVPSYLLVRAPDAEALLFNVTNIRDLTARGLKYFCHVSTIDALGLETQVRLPDIPNVGEVLPPKQSATRRILAPSGTFYSEAKARLSLRIKLMVTYTGQPSDENQYFYLVVLRTAQLTGPLGTVLPELGNMSIESSDEGIVQNIDDLLR